MLVFAILGTSLDAEQVRAQTERTVREIQSYLTNLRSNVTGLNSQLTGEARSTIETRRNKLLTNRNTVAALGFKMKEREDAPKTYLSPEVRKKIIPVMPTTSSASYKPEPAIGEKDYEHILGVMHGMTQVMELSPSAFYEIDEEASRSHFLVQLNGTTRAKPLGKPSITRERLTFLFDQRGAIYLSQSASFGLDQRCSPRR